MNILLTWIEQEADCQTARTLLALMKRSFTFLDYIPSRILLNWLRKEGGVEKETMEAWLLAQNEDLARQLLREGANPNAANGFALRSAVRKGRKEVLLALLKAGCDIHALGELALQIAVERGNVDFVNLILEKGGEESFKGNIWIKEIIRVAKKKEFEQIVQILEAAYNGDWKGAEKDEIFGLRSQTL